MKKSTPNGSASYLIQTPYGYHFRLKNELSKRIVPLHSGLAETLNFPAYVQRLKDKGEVRVFPELKKQSHAFSHAASKWLNGRYKKQVGIISEDGKKKVYQ